MIEKELRQLKQGNWFTIKPLEEPKADQVWVRDFYDRGSKSFCAYSYDDYNRTRFFKANRKVYTDFYF